MIDELSVQFADAWRSTSWVEVSAAVLAILYLVLAIRQQISCWTAAFLSSCLYVWVLFGARLYMESALNMFYAAMAVYGYRQWRGGGGLAGKPGAPSHDGSGPSAAALGVSHWAGRWHLLGLLGILCASYVTSYFLRRFTPAAWPFVDSMVTWASVFATFLVARKVYENWHWWLVIDSLSMVLYYTRRLYLTMLLFGLYLVLIGFGMRAWRRTLPAAYGA